MSVDKLLIYIQCFFLIPESSKSHYYYAAKNCRKLHNRLGDAWKAWEIAAAHSLGLTSDAPQSMSMSDLRREVVAEYIRNPTQASLDSLFHIFYATGDEIFLKVATGIPQMAQAYQRRLVDIRKKYAEHFPHYEGLNTRNTPLSPLDP